MSPPPDPPPDLPIDPIDELANELLDAGRLPTEPGLDPVVAARLGELVEVRARLRDVPLPAADERERVIAAALAAFDEQAVSSDASPSSARAATAPPPVPVRSLDRARAGRDRSAPSRWTGPILGVAAAAVVALGIAALARSSTHSEKSSSAGSLASTRAAAGAATAAAGASTTAADSAASRDLAAESATATGADDASQPTSSTAAAASATTAAAAKSIAPGGERSSTTVTTGGGLVDLGAIDDPTALIDRLVSLNVQLTSTPSSGTGTTAASPTGAFGPCGTAEAPAVALLRWKGVPAVVVPAIGGPSVRSLIDCSELVHL